MENLGISMKYPSTLKLYNLGVQVMKKRLYFFLFLLKDSYLMNYVYYIALVTKAFKQFELISSIIKDN